MKSESEVEDFERIESQLKVIRREIAGLCRKRPNDGVNKFKLAYINNVVDQANAVLARQRPLQGFEHFNLDDVPTNSDVTFVLAQYTEAMFRVRQEHTTSHRGKHYWLIRNKISEYETKPPSLLAYREKE